MKYIYIIIIVLLPLAAQAQSYRLDLNIRANTFALNETSDDQGDRYFGDFPAGFSAEVLFFPEDFIGVGAFYSKSVISGAFEYDRFNWYQYDYFTTDYDYSMYGISVQLTTNRKRFFRIYAVGRAGKFELVEDVGPFSIANSKLAYSGGFGVMLRLAPTVSFNLFEANYTFLPKEFSSGQDVAIGGFLVQSGISIRLLRK